jgi:hypothetical protein
MNTTARPVPTRFFREARFELSPKFAPLTNDQVQDAFERLKVRLLKPVITETPDPDIRRQLRLAANEAAAVAWTTPFPLLMLPVLLEEKSAEVHEYVARQNQIDQTGPPLVEAGP